MDPAPHHDKTGGPPGHCTDANAWAVGGICALLAAITFAVFGQTLRHGFVNYDDDRYVYENSTVTDGLTGAGIARAFTHETSGTWDPLTTLSHMLDCQLYGLNPGGHHLTNVLLHTASVILLFLLLTKMTGRLWESAFVAAVFAIHPLHVESVAWVSERKDTLSGFFFMLTLWSYARYATGPLKLSRYLVVVGCFALGLMSKAMLVTLPLVLLLVDYWPLGRFKGFRFSIGDLKPEGKDGPAGGLDRVAVPTRLLIEKIPLLALSLGSCAAAFVAQMEAQAVESLEKISFTLRIENALVSAALYIGQMFWPTRLAVLYPYPQNGIALGAIALAVVLLVTVSAAAWRWRRTRPYLAVGWAWYLVMLAPVIGLVQLGRQAHADRYTYLPQIGLYLALAWLAGSWCAGWRHRRLVLGAGAIFVVAVLSAGAFMQASYWHDSESLWTHTIACTTENAVAHYGLGLTVLEQGQEAEAEAEFQKAVDIESDYVEARNNLGYVLFQEGRADEAMTQFQRVEQIRPDYAENHNNLGRALHQQGRLDEAIREFQEALRLKPDFAEARFNLGNVFYQQGRLDEAAAEYEQVIRLEPKHWQARNNLGALLFRRGRLDEAIAQLEAVLEIQPGQAQARKTLRDIAWVLATSPNASERDGAKALELAQQLSGLPDGNDPQEQATLAAAYSETGKFADAVATAGRARQLALAQTNLPLAGALQEQMTVYQSGHAFRDTSPTNGPSY